MEQQIAIGLPRVIDTMKSLLFAPNDSLTDQQVMDAWEADISIFTHSLILKEAITLDTLHLRPYMPKSQIENTINQQNSFSNTINDNSNPTLNDRKLLLDSLQVIQTKIQQALETRLNQMTFKPRLYRVAERLSLSTQEIRAMVFIILTCSGVEQPSADERWTHTRSKSELYSCREFSGMNGAELLHFLSPSRKHFSQGLLEVDEELAALYTEAKFRAPREVLKAMYGCKLTLDEAMTLGTSVLSDVLAEESDAVLGADSSLLPTTKSENIDGISDISHFPENMPNSHERTTDDSAMLELLSQLQEEDKSRLQKGDKRERLTDSAGRSSSDIDQNPSSPVSNGRRSVNENDSSHESSDNVIANGDLNETQDDEVRTDDDITPYEDDMEYLKDGFEVVQEACKVYNFRETKNEEDRFTNTKRPVEALQREADAKFRKATNHFKRRLTKTTAVGGFLPRLELLAAKLKLVHFERMVILTLVGAVLSQSIRKTLRSDPSAYRSGITVAKLLRVHCGGDLGEEIKTRSYFYKNATLIRSGIITIDVPYDMPYSDLGDFCCELDHMVLDYVAGLHTELSEIMDSARCYAPNIDMNSVVLPERMKDVVLQRAENFEVFRRLRKEVGFDDIVRYGRGLTMLFHGKSGTGKTLFANALASYLGKKLLLVDFSSSSSSKHSTESYRIVFREAKIHGAIVFMDECDDLFEGRDRGGKGSVTVALREMETFDGIIILATNRPQTLDEAMHRRIALSVTFEIPDSNLRHEIWKKHIPKNLQLADDVDLRALAIEFELTGGYIKNAIFQALSQAVSRVQKERKAEKNNGEQEELSPLESKDVVITMNELIQACRLQARGDLKRTKLERRVLAKEGLDKLVVDDDTMKTLKDIVMVEKVRGVMSTRWGFKDRQTRSNCVLIFGSSGCGKSFAASCLGYEIGRSLQVVSASELHSSREGVSQIGDVFSQAAVAGAIVVVEHAEQLLYETAEIHNTASPGLELLFHMQSFDGLVVLCCTTAMTSAQAGWPFHIPIPNRVSSLLSYIVLLRPPHRKTRLQLWDQLIPTDTPIDDDVPEKLKEIASKYEFTGAKISSSIRRAAAAAAMRRNRAALTDPNADLSVIRLSSNDLENACEAEVQLANDADGTAAWVKGLYV